MILAVSIWHVMHAMADAGRGAATVCCHHGVTPHSSQPEAGLECAEGKLPGRLHPLSITPGCDTGQGRLQLPGKQCGDAACVIRRGLMSWIMPACCSDEYGAQTSSACSVLSCRHSIGARPDTSITKNQQPLSRGPDVCVPSTRTLKVSREHARRSGQTVPPRPARQSRFTAVEGTPRSTCSVFR